MNHFQRIAKWMMADDFDFSAELLELLKMEINVGQMEQELADLKEAQRDLQEMIKRYDLPPKKPSKLL